MGKELWTDAHLDAMREVADETADELIDQVYALGLSDAMNRHLRFGAALPADLQARLDVYLEQTQVLPPWADTRLIHECEAFFDLHGIVSSAILCCASLPECYLDQMDAPVLTSTTQLVKNVERRILETSHMVVNAMTEGKLEPHSDGVRAVQRVRLMHAAIRRLLSDNARAAAPADLDLQGKPGHLWNLAHGKPINQEAMAFVILTFSHVALRSLDRLGVEISDDERKAYLHTWSVVGCLMGVREELLVGKNADELATAADDAAYLFQTIKRRRCGESEYGKALTKAMLDWLTGQMPGFLKPVPRELLILLMGRDDAQRLGLEFGGRHDAEDSKWKAIILVVAAALRPLMRYGLMKRLAQGAFHAALKVEWDLHKDFDQSAFGLPPKLQTAWEPGTRPKPANPA